MLIPDSGDSMKMNVATKVPANNGVKRLRRVELDARRIVDIIRKEIVNSAEKATRTPAGPGGSGSSTS